MTGTALSLQVETRPSNQDLAYLEDQINRYNITHTGFDDYEPLAIFVRDGDGAIMAGISGFTWGGSCKINVLWVSEPLRGQGVGAALIQAAEMEARRRSCQVIVLETHAFQAPEFYKKYGYTVAGFRPDYPVGYGDYFFYKQLGAELDQ
ncbi:MAG: GNAT family N-acetyltransferase, partial [Caldilineaceae bacterium]|nr:GNAT family N-acetyltransferase [Caldilineaceae bacterium]